MRLRWARASFFSSDDNSVLARLREGPESEAGEWASGVIGVEARFAGLTKSEGDMLDDFVECSLRDVEERGKERMSEFEGILRGRTVYVEVVKEELSPTWLPRIYPPD